MKNFTGHVLKLGYDGSTAGDYDYASEVETPSTVAQQRRQRVQAGLSWRDRGGLWVKH